MRRPAAVPFVAALLLAAAVPAGAQGFRPATKPRPWSRVSFFSNMARTTVDGIAPIVRGELSTSFSYQLPESDDAGADYGVDVRYGRFVGIERPARTSIYEGFAGVRLFGGRLRVRGGHLWLSDVGALGSVAGGTLEFRQHRADDTHGRLRAAVFGGLEPNILDTGYAPDIRKLGGYLAWDGRDSQRSSLGYVAIRNGSLTERSVLTTTNFVPIRRRFYIYQSAEVNLTAPAGLARSGLAYFYGNARLVVTPRLELQGTYNRGRSVDTRGLGDDVVNGRPIVQSAVDGLLYESAGGRVSAEVAPRVRLYAGVSRDKNNRDADATRRLLVGGYASNILKSGVDVSGSDSLMDRATGSYHSRYVQVGRQFGRWLYLSGDYSTSLSVVRFSRSDGLVIETRPHTQRVSGTATATVSTAWSLMGTFERTTEAGLVELRALTGLTYRIR